MAATSSSLAEQTTRRRTFAIISHPDAGKTTLTEKLLLYSGLIRTAGMVKNRKGRAATSDWMGMERERGISVTSSAMQFPYKGTVINVLDTPGHEDFSEDTYRTLTAADSAIMVLDAGKGVERQTRKLFEVCKLRGIPVLTFINKLDLPGRDPLDLLTEVEDALGIQACAFNWPVGSGKEFAGVVDRRTREFQLFEKAAAGGAQESALERLPFEDSRVDDRLGAEVAGRVRGELELLEVAGNEYTDEAFLEGRVTPTFFGSALTNFGLEPFFDAFVELAPSPGARLVDLPDGTESRRRTDEPFSAFVFKIQANMDRRHRDCIAFLRICSGRYEPDAMVKHHRLGKAVRLTRPHSIVAQERNTLDEAFPGDVIGLVSRDNFRIGDTLSLDGGFEHKPLPQFQPELFARIEPKAVSMRKRFDKGMKNLIAEGAVQMFHPEDNPRNALSGAVGRLQFEVLQYRLEDEYDVATTMQPMPYTCSAWLKGQRESFQPTTTCLMTKDIHERTVVLFRTDWDKQAAAKNNPEHELLDMA
ncbi:MAG: peptide chain release factor 3 [Planctomycetota bacterium]|jgi:peptide chain release factor 3|nr:peptide chain release factor 3 [Planctomycetota bacterium]